MQARYARRDGNSGFFIVAVRKYFALNLRRYMQKNGLNQTELAAKLGVSQPTVSGWLRQEDWIAPENVDKLADLFEVTVDELFRNPESVKPIIEPAVMQRLDTMDKKIDLLIKKSLVNRT
jgi:transcriptional regulator with XRE-family HTH domain